MAKALAPRPLKPNTSNDSFLNGIRSLNLPSANAVAAAPKHRAAPLSSLGNLSLTIPVLQQLLKVEELAKTQLQSQETTQQPQPSSRHAYFVEQPAPEDLRKAASQSHAAQLQKVENISSGWFQKQVNIIGNGNGTCSLGLLGRGEKNGGEGGSYSYTVL